MFRRIFKGSNASSSKGNSSSESMSPESGHASDETSLNHDDKPQVQDNQAIPQNLQNGTKNRIDHNSNNSSFFSLSPDVSSISKGLTKVVNNSQNASNSPETENITMFLHERQLTAEDDPDMVIVDHCAIPQRPGNGNESDGLSPLSPQKNTHHSSQSPVELSPEGNPSKPSATSTRLKSQCDLNYTFLGGIDDISSGGESEPVKHDQTYTKEESNLSTGLLEDSVFLPDTDSPQTSSSSTSDSNSTPESSVGTKFKHTFYINKSRSASSTEPCTSNSSTTSTTSTTRSWSTGTCKTPENAEYNDWQFWKDTVKSIPLLLPQKISDDNPTSHIKSKEDNRNDLTRNKVDTQQSTASIASNNNSSHASFFSTCSSISVANPNQSSVSGVSSVGGKSASTTSSEHYYYLIPCETCRIKTNNQSETNNTGKVKATQCPKNPSVFYVGESSPSFCGHPRCLLQASREQVFYSSLNKTSSSCELISVYENKGAATTMGNQPGKEKDKEKGKKSKDKGKENNKRGNSSGSLVQGGPTPAKSLKNRPAPLPPVQKKGSDDSGPEGKTPSGVAELHLSIVDDDCPAAEEQRTAPFEEDREPVSDLDNDNDLSDIESITIADISYRTAATNGITGTESYHTALGSSKFHYDDDDTLRDQSDQLSIDSFELTMPTAESSGNLVFDEEDDGKFGISSSDIIGHPQRPMTTSFTLTRRRKVELSSVSSPVDELPPSSALGGRKDSTVSEQCLAGDHEIMGVGINCVPPRRYASVSDNMSPGCDSNVFRKVASLTLAEQQQLSRSKPKFIPEKLDFKMYEKFEGQTLINWFMASLQEGNYHKDILGPPDLKLMANHFCTMLLAAGVVKQIEDSSTPLDTIFRPDFMYYWSHSESPAISTQVPGKLPPVQWPPSKEALTARPAAKYTEAGGDGEEETTNNGVGITSRTLSPEHLPKPGIVPETVSHFESEIDLTRDDQEGKEFQNVMTGLKREHEVNLFSVRGETAQLLEKYAKRIGELEQEVETLKTLQDIQNLNQQLNQDFKAPEPLSGPPPPPPPPLPSSAPAPPPFIPPPPPPPLPGAILSSGNLSIVPPPPPPPPPSMGGGPPPPPPPPGMGGPPPPPLPGMGGPPPPPPPGMNGPCPFPPPPLMTKAEARKKPVNPVVPMKPLYWTRIQIKVPPAPALQVTPSGTVADVLDSSKEIKVWEKLDEVNVSSWDDFHKLFSRQVVEKKETKKKEENKPVKMQSMKVLDSKRSQTIGILIKSLNLDIEHVKQAIFDFDLSVLSLETLEKVLEVKATADESTLLKSHVESCPEIPLDKPDQFLYDLLSIPNYEARIMSLTFQCNYFEALTSIENKLSNLALVCEQLTGSKDVQKVLALILTYGNYMNGGNMSRGQADGFSLDILPKLKDVKSNDNNYTFLHFIVNKFLDLEGGVSKDNPEDAKLPVPEPSDIERASNTNFDDLELELKKLKTDLAVCERRMQTVIDTSEPEHLEPFRSKMTTFLEQAKQKLQEVDETFHDSKQRFSNTMIYFDFTPMKKAGSENPALEFFSVWTPFCQDFKAIWRNEQQKILKEKMKEAEKVVKQKRSLLKNIIIKKPRESMGLKEKLMRKKEKDKDKN